MEEAKLGLQDSANSKMEKVKRTDIPDGSGPLQIIKLARVKPPDSEIGEANNIMVMEVSGNQEDNQRNPIHQNMETIEEPQSTMRNLISKEGGDTINYNPAGGVSPCPID